MLFRSVRLKDVDEAQATIVILAKQLADSGEIIIGGAGEEIGRASCRERV